MATRPLVLFYSRTQTTKVIAQEIAQELSCDIEEIIDKKNRSGVIGWLSGGKDAARKKLTNIDEIEADINLHNPIIIGTPVWAGTLPPAIRTLLTHHHDRMQDIYLFTTQGSAKPQNTSQDTMIIVDKKLKGIEYFRTKDVKQLKYKKTLSDFLRQIKEGYNEKHRHQSTA